MVEVNDRRKENEKKKKLDLAASSYVRYDIYSWISKIGYRM
jgi:hypothetical protein